MWSRINKFSITSNNVWTISPELNFSKTWINQKFNRTTVHPTAIFKNIILIFIHISSARF